MQFIDSIDDLKIEKSKQEDLQDNFENGQEISFYTGSERISNPILIYGYGQKICVRIPIQTYKSLIASSDLKIWISCSFCCKEGVERNDLSWLKRLDIRLFIFLATYQKNYFLTEEYFIFSIPLDVLFDFIPPSVHIAVLFGSNKRNSVKSIVVTYLKEENQKRTFNIRFDKNCSTIYYFNLDHLDGKEFFVLHNFKDPLIHIDEDNEPIFIPIFGKEKVGYLVKPKVIESSDSYPFNIHVCGGKNNVQDFDMEALTTYLSFSSV